MRYVAETTKELDALLAKAENEPVFIERGQREIAVLVSVREYERLNDAANRDFQNFCDRVSEKAEVRGFRRVKAARFVERCRIDRGSLWTRMFSSADFFLDIR